jgi:Signal transduction histidine kinase
MLSFLKNLFSRIFVRVFLSILGMCALIIAALTLVAFWMFDAFYNKNLEESLMNSSAIIAASIRNGESMDFVAAVCADFAKQSEIRTTIIARNGNIVFDSDAELDGMTNHLNRPEISRALEGKSTFVSRYSNTLNTHMLYLAVLAGQESDGGFEYCVRLAVAKRNMDFAKSVLMREIVVIAAAAIFFSAAVSLILARRISRPIKSLGEHASEFARGNFDSRVEESSIYEISELGKLMTEMARQLKKRISSLHKRNCELDEIFSHMSECVLICSDEGLLLKANDSARKVFNIKTNDTLRPKIEDAIQNRNLISAIVKTFSEGKEMRCDIEVGDKIMALESVALPYESRTRRAIFVLRDISVAKAAEMQRREFVAGVSHELKTPIAAIMGAVEILKEDTDADNLNKLLDIIERDSKRMNALVDNMLTLSKLDAPEYLPSLKFKSAKIFTILGDVRNAYEHEASKCGQTIELLCGVDLCAPVDTSLISLAVSNLISNAIKYSGEKSQIKICADETADEISINVSDNGCGVDPAHQERVFERFYRVEKGRWRETGGSGIGLAIVKHVAILHGGTATLESESGRGATFKITLKKKH